MHFKIIGRGLVPATPTPVLMPVLLIVGADKCHLFNVYVDHSVDKSDHYHLHVDCSTKRE